MTIHQANEAVLLRNRTPEGLNPEEIEHKFPALAEKVRRITDEQRHWWGYQPQPTKEK